MTYYSFDPKYILLIFFCSISSVNAQQTELKGKIIDAISGANLEKVTVSIKKTKVSVLTTTFGEFDFRDTKLPLGEQVLIISKDGYVTKRFPITINEGNVLDLKKIDLQFDFNTEQQQIGTISLSDHELDEDNDISFSVSGLLQSTRDVFLTAAAFDFSSTFFRPRGLGNENGKILINGIEMNKFSNGRPQWSNWGGLNDVQRNQEFSLGISENDYTFGDLLGTSNIIMRASKYRKGGKISYAFSNRSYQGRVIGTYNSGVTEKGWAFSVSLSRRYGKEGFVEGTLYDSNSFFVSIEKKLGKKHSLNLTGFYTPNRRGRSTAITDEVFNLKGNNYNPNWGYLNGEIRNSKERKIEEPVFMLNHYWSISKKTHLQTNIAFQTGKIANSRIDNGGSDLIIGPNAQQTYIGGGRSANTNPVHPDNMPSSFLEGPNPTPLDYQNAFLAQQNLINNGQLNWRDILQTNQQNAQKGNNSTYILYEDRTDDALLSGNMILNSQFNTYITLNAAIGYKNLKSQNFAEVTDLLGGTGFLDVDVFALSSTELTSSELTSRAQSDLRNPNRIVGVGDRYDYNYEIEASAINGFLQGQFKLKRVNFFLGGTISQTIYQRNGLFENGYFPGNDSFGKSEALNFMNYGVKGGATIAINGHHFIKLQSVYFNKPPTIRNAFANARYNNSTIAKLIGEDQESEKIQSVDGSYIFRSPKIKARLTGYYSKILDATNISFFFTEAISGSDVGFVQEILTDIDKRYIGGEFGVEYQITPTIKIKGAAAVGSFVFDNDLDLVLTSTSEAFSDIEGIQSFGKSALKGYHIAGGPQRAGQLGFEYRDPDFWWFGATTNYFSNAYINISPFARTANFYRDTDGLPFNDYDEDVAKQLLRQEQFKDYFLVNAIGGKSWRIKKYYIGFFASINNILDQGYKTGGFEQARNANYRLALEESQRDTPVYGSKYFYGYGTSYYLNVYIRF
ncbi:carboxypeptidase-like regulatory domain-containing protein [Aquimarina megaterium]|uniref:carboxypeptidase-like regulatory domain-containing protein n=1 Tax=Aquimarina megaterium TaxID=1443666 RepID=UPI0004724C1F|nr:carboxypeptidase-like regulatory domain-containing protein [Aquimarina megaterium]